MELVCDLLLPCHICNANGCSFWLVGRCECMLAATVDETFPVRMCVALLSCFFDLGN